MPSRRSYFASQFFIGAWGWSRGAAALTPDLEHLSVSWFGAEPMMGYAQILDLGHRTADRPPEVDDLRRGRHSLHVNPKTVRRRADAGKLTATLAIGGHRRYHRTEVEALLHNAHEATEPPHSK